MSEGFPGLPGSDMMPRRTPRFRGLVIAQAILFALFALWAGWHVVPALMVKDNPPIACQIDGGSWSFWSGWSCR